MKAEHRKELETNTLADRMGHVMQRVKTGRRSTFLIYAIVAAVVVGVSWYVYVTMQESRQQQSNLWLLMDDGSQDNLKYLAARHKDEAAGKAARLQLAWFDYWERGIMRLGAEPFSAIQYLNQASSHYKEVAAQSKDDPMFEPQALLGFAIVEESKTVYDPASLDSAASAYKVIFENEKYKDTAEGKYAKARYDELKDDKKRAVIAAVYEDMRKGMNVRALPQFLQDMPKDKLHQKFLEKK